MIRIFNRYWSPAALLSVLVEAGLLLLAVWVAYYVRFAVFYGRVEEIRFAYFSSHFLLRAATFSAVVLVSFYLHGLYDFDKRLELRDLLFRIFRAFTLSAIGLLAVFYVTYPMLTTGRGAFAVAMTLGATLVTGWRLLLRWVLTKGALGERILIVGTDASARDLARELLRQQHLGHRVVGFVDDDPQVQGLSVVNPRVLGTSAQVSDLARRHEVTRVVVAQQDRRGKLDLDRLLECKTSGITVEQGTDYYERLTGKIMLEGLRKSWLIFSEGFLVSRSILVVKRLMDVTVSVAILLLSLPVLVVTTVAIRFDSAGPVLFRQDRVGRNGRVFTLWKFRSMAVDAESAGDPRWAEAEDPRVTRVGRLIRKARIDELPQCWNVLKGDMSFVGPRPERQPFVERLHEISPFYSQRHVVRPGITGWAQVKAPYAASFEDSLEKLKYDLYYVKNLSPFLDLSILASTARIVLFGRGAR